MQTSTSSNLVDNSAQDSRLEEKTIIEALDDAVGSDEFSDVVFVVGEEKKRIPAHRAILAIRSPVFAAMLFGHMKESHIGVEINIVDIEPVTFLPLLRYIYTGKVDLDGANPIKMLYGANKYGFTKLAGIVRREAQSTISIENVTMYLNESMKAGDDLLSQASLDFALRNGKAVFNSAGLEHISEAALTSLIRQDELMAPESDIFRACLTWANAECDRQKLEATPENLRHVLDPIIHYIRFPLLSQKEVSTFVHSTKILSQEELLSLLLHLTSGGQSPCTLFPSQPRLAAMRFHTDKILIMGAESCAGYQKVVLDCISGCGDKVCELFDAYSGTPTIEKLDEYRAVFVWSNSRFAEKNKMSTVLADYVDRGGGVVVATFALKDTDEKCALTAPFLDHLPVRPGENLFGQHQFMGDVLEPNHPIMAGVTELNAGSTAHRNSVTARSGATTIALWDDKLPLVVVWDRSNSRGRVAALSFWPIPNGKSGASDGWEITSDGGKLMYNSLVWVGKMSMT